MKIAYAVGRHPKEWLLVEAFLCVAVVAVIDSQTPWQFSLFVFYSAPIFLVALRFGQRGGIAFAILTTGVSWFANLDTQPFGNFTGYGWSSLNRLSAFLFVAICGASISRFREETRRRVEALEHAQKLEHEIVRAGDREQMRIGQDLHDSVCQSLAALDCATECLKAELESGALPQAATAQQIQKLLRETTIEARNLARGLVPVSTEPDGLVTALRGLVATMNSLRHTAIKFECRGEIEIADADVATHLYRIAQEALSNALRHANAAQVVVSVAQEEDSLQIIVSDDGCGSSIRPGSDGMGWRTMRYRAALIGADLEVKTSPTAGTAVRCTLSLPVSLRGRLGSEPGPLARRAG